MNLLFLLLGGGLGYAIFRPQEKDVVVVTDDEGVAGGLAGVTSIEIDGADTLDNLETASAESDGVPDKIFGGTDDVFGGGDVQTGTSTTIKDPRPTGVDVTGSPVSTLGGGYSSPVKRPTGKPAPTSISQTKLVESQRRRSIPPNPRIRGDRGTAFGRVTRQPIPKKKGFDGLYTDFDGVEDKNYGGRTGFDGVE